MKKKHKFLNKFLDGLMIFFTGMFILTIVVGGLMGIVTVCDRFNISGIKGFLIVIGYLSILFAIGYGGLND